MERGARGDAMTAAWLHRLTGGDPTPAPGRVDVRQAYENLSADKLAQVVDVREPNEWAETGVLPRALLIPLGQIELRAAEIAKGRPVYTICRSGNRSMTAAKKLAKLGYTDVKSIDGGMRAWVAAGLPVKVYTR
jgi:rhodanese-related sulfurtransferase